MQTLHIRSERERERERIGKERSPPGNGRRCSQAVRERCAGEKELAATMGGGRRAWSWRRRRRRSWWLIWGERREKGLVLVRGGRAGEQVRVIPSAAAVHGWMWRWARATASGCGSGVLSVSLSPPLVPPFFLCKIYNSSLRDV
jgi:hypothetical protein